MHNFVCLNHQIISAETASLSAISSAALYGKGIFTTIAIYNSKPFLWEKHWRRLTENAQAIRLDLSSFTEDAVRESFSGIIKKNNLTRARARFTFFDESSSNIWKTDAESKTSFLIQTADLRSVSKKIRLTVSPFLINSTSPLAAVKSCNYLENILDLENARAAGFDEAVRLNERGEIASACMANVFWEKDGAIYTPSLETGCLNGTTRSFILENFSVEEKTAELYELKEADKIFLTSAGIGVAEAIYLK